MWGGACLSSVYNIDCPCNEFLVPPPPQFERLNDSVCVCVHACVHVCVLTDGK